MPRRRNFYAVSKLLGDLNLYQPEHIYLYDAQACLEIDIDLLSQLLDERRKTKSPVRLSIPHPGIAILTVISPIRPWTRKLEGRMQRFVFGPYKRRYKTIERPKRPVESKQKTSRMLAELVTVAPRSALAADQMCLASLFFSRLRRRSEQASQPNTIRTKISGVLMADSASVFLDKITTTTI